MALSLPLSTAVRCSWQRVQQGHMEKGMQDRVHDFRVAHLRDGSDRVVACVGLRLEVLGLLVCSQPKLVVPAWHQVTTSLFIFISLIYYLYLLLGNLCCD
jgi:hypothetical protein